MYGDMYLEMKSNIFVLAETKSHTHRHIPFSTFGKMHDKNSVNGRVQIRCGRIHSIHLHVHVLIWNNCGRGGRQRESGTGSTIFSYSGNTGILSSDHLLSALMLYQWRMDSPLNGGKFLLDITWLLLDCSIRKHASICSINQLVRCCHIASWHRYTNREPTNRQRTQMEGKCNCLSIIRGIWRMRH